MRRVLLSLPAAAVLLVSGCADPGADSGTQPGPGAGSGSSATAGPSQTLPTPSPSRRLPTPLPTSPGSSKPPPSATGGTPLTLEGVVQEGVEPGCRVLTAASGTYLLIGRRDVPQGVRVRVRGVVLTGVSTTCQQGTPLRVLDVQRR
jgi:hypothetical protein